jgi:hypothetical protein
MVQRSDSNLDRLERKERSKPSQVQWQRAQVLLCLSAATAGTLVLLGACLYRRARHPEWTGAQALEALWPLYLASALSICLGWLFSDGKGK